MASHKDNNTYQTHHNLTTVDKDASIFGYANGGPLKQCDFQMHTGDPGRHLIMLSIDIPHFDPMMYALFYPYGTGSGSLIMSFDTIIMQGKNKHDSQCCKDKWIKQSSELVTQKSCSTNKTHLYNTYELFKRTRKGTIRFCSNWCCC